jgi:hypothetical protein
MICDGVDPAERFQPKTITIITGAICCADLGPLLTSYPRTSKLFPQSKNLLAVALYWQSITAVIRSADSH